MENASKALIIAGAILLAILLISLGIMVYRQAAGVIDSNAMDEVAVSSFNQKFMQYEGSNVRGTNVNALINTVIQNNLTNASDASKQVNIRGTSLEVNDNWKTYVPSAADNGQTSTAKTGTAMTGRSYSVTTHKNSKSGYVDYITIKGI